MRCDVRRVRGFFMEEVVWQERSVDMMERVVVLCARRLVENLCISSSGEDTSCVLSGRGDAHERCHSAHLS